MANALTRFLNPETGGLGLKRLEEARASGLSDADIKRLLPGSGIKALPERAAAALGQQTFNVHNGDPAPQAPAWQPASTNELTQFVNPETGGLGLKALERARAAGYTDADFRRLIPGSGAIALGYRAANTLGLDQSDRGLQGNALYERAFQASLRDYQTALQTKVEQQVSTLSQQSQQLQSNLAAAQKERDDAKARAQELEEEQKAQREFAVNEQLSSLRSGSTVSGSPGAGLGSLQAGRSSYSVKTNASRGSVLDRAYKDIDPTDSVLDKNVAAEAAQAATGGGGGNRASARQRALAAGGSASNYYARRFG
jgi:hypothetical protein